MLIISPNICNDPAAHAVILGIASCFEQAESTMFLQINMHTEEQHPWNTSRQHGKGGVSHYLRSLQDAAKRWGRGGEGE